MSQVDEIKARVDIVDLISEYIRLKQSGTNWKALCPFHNEKSPSFMVSREKQIWHCFGCAEGGDIFSFVQKMESVDFPEALRILAQKAGVKLIAQDPEVSSQKNRLMDICQLATNYWHKILLESSQAQKVRDYLAQRKISEQTISEFKLGYAIDSWDNLIKFLKTRGFKDQEIFLAGLSVQKERGSDFYDRFRDRLIFPINDLHGSPIGFSARTLKADEKMGKYINTPQTLIYNKSLVIFNLDKAKTEIKKQDLAVVVEGQMDTLAVWQSGMNNIIATSGTAFTVDQIKILKRYTNNLAIAFDADLAGQAAAGRGIDLALAEEMNVKVIVLPFGKDPDECIKNNPADWSSAVKNAKSILDYYFSKTFDQLDLNKAEDKKQAAKILLPVIAKIGNKIEQNHWLKKLADTLAVSENILLESFKRQVNDKKNTSVIKTRPEVVVKDRERMLLEQILAIVLKHPNQTAYLVDNLPLDFVRDEDLAVLYKELIIYYTESVNHQSESFDYSIFKQRIADNNLKLLADRLVLLAEKDFFDFDLDTIRDEFITAIVSYQKSYYKNRQKELMEMIKQAEKQKQQETLSDLTKNFQEVTDKLRLLDQ